MDWERLEISILESEKDRYGTDSNEEFGLDINAEKMHDSFLNRLTHLNDVKSSHNNMISKLAGSMEDEKVSLKEIRNLSFFKDISKSIEIKSNFLIPLESNSPKDIIVEINKKRTHLRIIVPNTFGGNVEEFLINDDIKISKGIWSQGTLELSN
ncbi:MAG: hypothetical protein HOD35_06170 [Euryarchaeota archaeon]|jgi:hypothetical protein|nr:hypothetical protein [Euryarchaeota archaeon]MBT4392220.1 hypothetical protein [Euryarchaeota archaeon]MBT4803256.1 hypothetical protein [Euryarchaeota archaeon]MBT6683536.1 hypothetical protein [Euryarchaeota archaeon]MBT6874356.1 hypothetical protein [Euryarchaeota archaeon]